MNACTVDGEWAGKGLFVWLTRFFSCFAVALGIVTSFPVVSSTADPAQDTIVDSRIRYFLRHKAYE
ncbi:MAG: hypothetical protein D6820_11045, partial [Lentisphaerae bacterium]